MRDSAALRIAVAAGFVVAGACAYLLVSGRMDGGAPLQAACPACAVPQPAGSVPPAEASHAGRAVAVGSATPPPRSRSVPPASGSSQSSLPSGAVSAASSVGSSASTSPVTVQFKVTSQWTGRYRAELTLTNTGAAAVADWRLALTVAPATMTAADDSLASEAAGTVTVHPEDWNPELAPGESVTLHFGFDGVPQKPGGCQVSGAPCAVTFVPYPVR